MPTPEWNAKLKQLVEQVINDQRYGYDALASSSWKDVVSHWDERTADPTQPTNRIPLRLWVTHRIASEGGDWPVRCSHGEPNLPGWHEIQLDNNGGFFMAIAEQAPAAEVNE
jgi:hypothetical protein